MSNRIIRKSKVPQILPITNQLALIPTRSSHQYISYDSSKKKKKKKRDSPKVTNSSIMH